MRTNNFSKKQNALKAVALVTLLLTCFVFAFAMTYTLIDFGIEPNDTAFADIQGDVQGGTTAVAGDKGNVPNTSEAGFKGLTEEDGKYVWSYTESFSNTVFSKSNISMRNKIWGVTTFTSQTSYDFTYIDKNASDYKTGVFGWSTEERRFTMVHLAYVNYAIPQFVRNLVSGGVAVTATISAKLELTDGASSGYGIAVSTSTTSPGTVPENPSYSSSVSVSSNSNYAQLIFWGKSEGGVTSAKAIAAKISDISVTFSVSLTSAQASSKAVEAFGDNKIVAQSLYESSTVDEFAPYNNTINQTNGDSTWPVWYDSIKNNLSSAVDSVSGGQGTLQSYTSTPIDTIGGYAYYKTSKVTYVGTYAYAFPATASSYSGTDANTSFAVGVKTVQVGSEDSTTDGDGKGAVFDVTAMSNGGSSSKAVYVENELVGYAKVTRVSRAKVEVTTYVYKNTDITTKVLDTSYTASASSFKISYKGIDTTAPNRLDVDSEEATSVIGNVSTINWWRNRVLTLETSVDDETEDAYSPYVWFYEVKRYDTLADLTSDTSGATYSNYSQIKTAGIEPFAFDSSGQLATFEYNFATGKATGINSAQIAGGVNATKSGYYRFIFYSVDLAGNAIATSTYYVKADYDKPTFDTLIRYEYPEHSDEWYRITNEGEGSDLKNGAWALGNTQVVVKLSYD
ncbi:MAG: hypothetical protein IJ226_01135, partial [Clostridia bacterium]|nr:hypothetical protein [Clostridia bacterium]